MNGAPILASKPQRLTAALALIFATILWGGWFPVTRLGVTSGAITAWDMPLLRCSAGAIVLLPIVLRHGIKAGNAGWFGTLIILATLSGPFALGIGYGIQYAPSAHAAIFVPGCFPALVFAIGIIFLGDKASLRRFLGLGAVILGVVIIGWVALSTGNAGAFQGYLAFHACAWMWAIYTVVVRITGLSPWHSLAITHVGAAAVYGPIWLLVGDSGLTTLPLPELAFQIGYHGVLNGLVAMFLYVYGIRILGASEAAIFAALVPCFAAVLAWPLIGEAIGPAEALAILSVTIGIALVSGAKLPWAGGHRS